MDSLDKQLEFHPDLHGILSFQQTLSIHATVSVDGLAGLQDSTHLRNSFQSRIFQNKQ